ncbi:MAG: RNA polymerase sigma factor [Gemmataceae bacterium]
MASSSPDRGGETNGHHAAQPNDATQRVISDQSLLTRVEHGSQGAAGTLYERYASRLLALAKARCGDDLRSRVDAEDIVQSVFGSFFRGASQGLYSVPSGDEIWGVLLVIALNKMRSKGRHHRSAKRDVRKTVSGDQLSQNGIEPPATDSATHAMLQMVIDEVLAKLPAGYHQVVRMRIEGYEVAEIAAKTGRSLRTTERVLQDFRARIAAEFAEDSHDG